MSSISHQTVDNIMHIFNAVVSAASAVSVSRVGEWCIIGLLGDELVGKDSKAVFFCFVFCNQQREEVVIQHAGSIPTYDGPLATNCLLTSVG